MRNSRDAGPLERNIEKKSAPPTEPAAKLDDDRQKRGSVLCLHVYSGRIKRKERKEVGKALTRVPTGSKGVGTKDKNLAGASERESYNLRKSRLNTNDGRRGFAGA